jgi:PAS domain S-box-containing protein
LVNFPTRQIISIHWNNPIKDQSKTKQALIHELASLRQRIAELEQSESDRKGMEEALRQSEDKYRTIFKTASTANVIFDEDTTISLINKEFEGVYGYSKEELEGKRSWTELIVKEDLERVIAYDQARNVNPDAAPRNYEFRAIDKEGNVKNIFVTIAMIPATKKRVAFFLDITEHKKTEEHLRLTLEATNDGMWDWNIPTGKAVFSPRYYRILGFEPGEFPENYDAWRRLIHPDDVDRAEREINEHINENTGYAIEIRMRTKSGDWRWILTRGMVVERDVENRPIRMVGTHSDITERKQAEEALRESEELVAKAFRSIPDALAISRLEDGKIVEVNDSWHKVFGYSREEVIGKKSLALNLFADSADRQRVMALLRKQGFVHDFELQIRQKSGALRTAILSIELQNTQGEQYLLSVVQDITERKRAAEEVRTSHLQLRALYKRLQQIREEDRIAIAREVHDEMGGGLTGLKMDLTWLLRKMGNADMDEERVALMDKIHTANALIDHMIQVVRRVSAHLRPSVLDDLGLIAALEWQLSEFTSRTEIPHEFTTSFEYVNMEETTAITVFRIFQEALTNVARHSRATKVVVVLREGERSLFGDESLVLEIRDNGRGITEEEILNPESLGLLGMKERVLAFGGELSIRGKPGGGTALILQITRKQGEAS